MKYAANSTPNSQKKHHTILNAAQCQNFWNDQVKCSQNLTLVRKTYQEIDNPVLIHLIKSSLKILTSTLYQYQNSKSKTNRPLHVND